MGSPGDPLRAESLRIEILLAYRAISLSYSFSLVTRGFLLCLLGFWPLGQNPAGVTSMAKLQEVFNSPLVIATKIAFAFDK